MHLSNEEVGLLETLTHSERVVGRIEPDEQAPQGLSLLVVRTPKSGILKVGCRNQQQQHPWEIGEWVDMGRFYNVSREAGWYHLQICTNWAPAWIRA